MNVIELKNRVALRYRAIWLDTDRKTLSEKEYVPSAAVLAMTARLVQCGYMVSEELLHALATMDDSNLTEIADVIDNVYGVKLNWTPLVKQWDVPTGESVIDHLITFFVNEFVQGKGVRGVQLPCGHFIPDGTFPMERYNGCPYCGTPFRTSDSVYKGQGSKLKQLRLFDNKDINDLFVQLLSSPVPLDATQLDSVKLLVQCMSIPKDIDIIVKETCMVVVSELVKKGLDDEAARYLHTPTDILRYLWYEKTGKAVIIRPKVIVRLTKLWKGVLPQGPYWGSAVREKVKDSLRLKYSRKECLRVAMWLNSLPMSAQAAAENMHPYRGMWVRFIRALRLPEYSKRPGFDKLLELMDVFYNQRYETWAGKLNDAIDGKDCERTLAMLSTRPGLFARCLFSCMLHFGAEPVLEAFRAVSQQVPPRLVLSLTNAATLYFDEETPRYASPVTGDKVKIPHNKLLALYSKEECDGMVEAVKQLFLNVMSERFGKETTEHKTIYINQCLYDIPVGVGDRGSTIQDASCALQGMRFPVEGDSVRLFMHWGVDMPAQHLDMDLSCRIIYDFWVEDCAYYNLSPRGARHSGDIRSIPDKVGTAEYIELNLPALRRANARYAIFTCHAYSPGKLPKMLVGWMDSANPMTISEETGVAYDPSCVQHIVRIGDENLSKGMVFGILDFSTNEITWLEEANMTQALFQMNASGVIDYLHRLRQKCSMGQLLDVKANAQNLQIIEDPTLADEVYDITWTLNPVNMNDLLK